MRKIVLSLTALSLCLITKAQFAVALVGGPQVNSTNPAFSVHPDNFSAYTQTKYTGLNFGFVGHIPMNKKQTLFFRSGALFSARGSQVFQLFDTANRDLTKGENYLNGTTTLKLKYIDVPLNFLLKLPMKGKTKFVLGGGLQGSLFYNGSTVFGGMEIHKIRRDSAASEPEFKETTNNDLPVGNVDNKFRSFHYCANGLAGFEFGRAFINVTYNHGLSEFFKSGDQSFKHRTLGFHFGIFLGSPTPKVEVVKDRDNDGVTDDLDVCPDLPGTAITKGCPDKDGDGIADKDDKCPDQAGALKENGCPVLDKDADGIRDEEDKCPEQAGLLQNGGCPVLDQDSDGVPDAEDKCPAVAGVKKYNGCPVPDTDKDGVNDDDDKCPTVAGAKDNLGCPKVTKEEQQKVSYAAKKIQFEFKKAEVSLSSHKLLDEVVNILKNNPTLKIKVEGHTSGPDSESNQLLSQKRADSVKDYFISKGIESGRITSKGFGSTRPISKEGNIVENPADRRVEMIIF